MIRFTKTSFLLAFGTLLLAGCANKQAKPAAPPTPEVSVLEVATEPVTITTELPGRVNRMREAQVRARATRILLQRLFEDGAAVEAGSVLFALDPLPRQAALKSAKAVYARTEATVKEAQATVYRSTELVEISALIKQVFDQALATNAHAK